MYFEGVTPAALTPFDESGAVDTAALRRNTEWVLDQGAAGLVGNGTMGEAPSLSPAERRLVLETLVETAAGRGHDHGRDLQRKPRHIDRPRC